MTRISELKKQWMDDPQFRKEYEDADAEYEVIQTLIKARNDAELSQAELAQRIGTTQSAIARLEGGGVSPTISTLRRYAKATGTKLQVSLSRE
jgi:ribosome-binding protein aMBF1 (putative translation factor)